MKAIFHPLDRSGRFSAHSPLCRSKSGEAEDVERTWVPEEAAPECR